MPVYDFNQMLCKWWGVGGEDVSHGSLQLNTAVLTPNPIPNLTLWDLLAASKEFCTKRRLFSVNGSLKRNSGFIIINNPMIRMYAMSWLV